jgi:hypothetical protein
LKRRDLQLAVCTDSGEGVNCDGINTPLCSAKLETSVAQAMALGCTDVAAIRHLLMSDQLQHATVTTVEIGALAAYERPLPTMAEYNQLLAIEVLA